MNASHHSGSCLCGNVRFEVTGDFQSFFLCHCAHCRKDTGSAHAANLFSTTARINWLCGFDKVHSFHLPTTQHVKSFCADCGSAMPSVQMDGQLLVVPAGALDDDIGIRPTAHIFCASRANWDSGLDSIPQFSQLPG